MSVLFLPLSYGVYITNHVSLELVLFLFLLVKRLLSNLNIMSLVAVKKRKSGKNRKDRNKVDRKVKTFNNRSDCLTSNAIDIIKKLQKYFSYLYGSLTADC